MFHKETVVLPTSKGCLTLQCRLWFITLSKLCIEIREVPDTANKSKSWRKRQRKKARKQENKARQQRKTL